MNYYYIQYTEEHYDVQAIIHLKQYQNKVFVRANDFESACEKIKKLAPKNWIAHSFINLTIE